MRAEVERFIAREQLLAQREPVWVAVSGGVDSMVLLHVLRALRHPCSAVHVDHGLRGAESDGDRAFVEAYCAGQKVPFRALRVDPVAEAEEQGGSVQMAARSLRYAWFNELLQEGPHRMALGHHADDAVETLLLHLMRGTGVHGWAAIPAKAGAFVRPLLAVDRAAIQAYAAEHQVPFREDASNADPKYLRNRVRAEVLPLLEQLRPGAKRAMARSIDVLREIQGLAEERMRTQHSSDARLSFAELESSSTPLLLLRVWLADTGFHPDVLDDIRQAVAHRRTGAQFRAGAVRVSVDRDALLLDRPSAERTVYRIGPFVNGAGGPFTWEFDAAFPEKLVSGADVAWLDADRLHFPLVLRPWLNGDRMRPIGLNGSKLVSDLLIDAKVPRPQKDNAYVLLSGEEIVWLAGVRVGEGAQVGPDTRRVLRIGLAR